MTNRTQSVERHGGSSCRLPREEKHVAMLPSWRANNPHFTSEVSHWESLRLSGYHQEQKM